MEQITRPAKLLVVAHDSTILQSILTAAQSNHWQLDVTGSAWDALEKLHFGLRADLLFVDLFHAEIDSFHILRWLRRVRPELPMMLIDRVDDANRRHKALQLGPCDYLVSSAAAFHLEAAIQHNLCLACDRDFTVSPSSTRPTGIAKRQHLVGADGYKSLRSLLQSVREDAEKNAIALALEKTGWNRKAAARLLKISYRSILYKIEQYQMNSFGRSTLPMTEKLEPGSGVHLNAPELELARVAGRSA
jgi:DNA-binding NtrC family response regulator